MKIKGTVQIRAVWGKKRKMAAKILVFCGFECSTSNENWQAETRGFEN